MKRDRIRNQVIRRQLRIESAEETLVVQRLRHVSRISKERIVRLIFETKEDRKEKRGRPNETWLQGLNKDISRRDNNWKELKEVIMDRDVSRVN